MSQRRSQFNEGRACDAVIRYLERRSGAVRANVQFPDRDRFAVPIEVAFDLSGTLFAMEHTGIEPFEGHTKLQATASIGIRPIAAAVEGQLSPTEDFELHIPMGAFDGLGRRRLEEVHKLIADWVLETWPKLAIAPIGRYDTSVMPTSIPGVPFEVKLYRLAGLVKPGSLQVVHVVRDVESLRQARMRAALEKKLPKLSKWKEKFSARTVLVLEQNDIQLTNVHLVTDALLTAETQLTGIADEVYLVTSTITPWWVHFVRVDGRSYFDLTNPDDRAWEIDPASLTSITDRHI
jgi:hypothetical protein